MNSRELRRQRRAAERKASKLQNKQQAAVASPSSVSSITLSDLSHPDGDFEVSQNVPLPPSPERAARNRQNAQFSSGPRTIAGKEASSRNSFKHGLASGELIIAGEDEDRYRQLLASLVEEHAPATPTESLLVDEMAQSHWLASRALKLQNSCLKANEVDAKGLALFLRYHSTHQRNFYKALTELRRLQKERLATLPTPAIGFVSQNDVAPHEQLGFVSQNRFPSVEQVGFASQNQPNRPRTSEEIADDWMRQRGIAA